MTSAPSIVPVLDLSADITTLTAAVCDIESVSLDEATLCDAIEAALRPLAHLEVTRIGKSLVARTSLGRPERVVLAGLREASSAEQAFAASAAAPLGQRDRTASSKLAGRERPKKSSGSRGSNSAAVTEDGADDSAAPSPRITLGQASRLGAKDKSSRAGSIPATRETSVKIEDGVESVAVKPL